MIVYQKNTPQIHSICGCLPYIIKKNSKAKVMIIEKTAISIAGLLPFSGSLSINNYYKGTCPVPSHSSHSS